MVACGRRKSSWLFQRCVSVWYFCSMLLVSCRAAHVRGRVEANVDIDIVEKELTRLP